MLKCDDIKWKKTMFYVVKWSNLVRLENIVMIYISKVHAIHSGVGTSESPSYQLFLIQTISGIWN